MHLSLGWFEGGDGCGLGSFASLVRCLTRDSCHSKQNKPVVDAEVQKVLDKTDIDEKVVAAAKEAQAQVQAVLDKTDLGETRTEDSDLNPSCSFWFRKTRSTDEKAKALVEEGSAKAKALYEQGKAKVQEFLDSVDFGERA